jgi:hypothetical protein
MYAGVVAGRQVKGATAGDFSAPLPAINGALQEGKGWRGERASGRPGPPEGEGRHGGDNRLRTLGRSLLRAKQAKWDAQANSQRYRHYASTRCFSGSCP